MSDSRPRSPHPTAYGTTEFDSLVVPDDYPPEALLLIAMIQRAFTDMFDSTVKQHDRTSARVWLHSTSHEPFSFRWACEVISSDPETFRRKILWAVKNNHRGNPVVFRSGG